MSGQISSVSRSLLISRKRTWPTSSEDSPFREISDIIYGTIPLYYPLNLIVDTPEFQRLRRLKQTGVVYLVYPSSEHSRFQHCLGVQHLARVFIKALAEKYDLNIDSRDQLCVAIAGLCHDLGHGPFSHLFDGALLQALNTKTSWTHEEGSVLLFERICLYASIKRALDEFLEPEDYIFIKELINPPKSKFNENGDWTCRGRPVEKSFLYDLICNVNDSLDVDKYDYLLRDSVYTAVAIPFNLSSVKRIKDWMMPLEVIDESSPHGYKFLRLCYAYKILDDLHSVGESRYLLHNRVYNHRAVRACEHLLVCACVAAAPFLKFLGDDGRQYSLTNITENMGAFLRCDDSVLQMIISSTSSELNDARYYMDCLLHRCLPKFVGGVDLLYGASINEKALKDAIIDSMDENVISPEEFIVCLRNLHRGMGTERSPMSAVRLYNHKSSSQKIEAFPIDKHWLEKNPRFLGGNISINIYIAYEIYKQREWIVEEVHKAFSKVLKKSGWLSAKLFLPLLNPSSSEHNNDSKVALGNNI